MLDLFADKTRLVRILSQCLALGGGLRVVLGRDSDVALELDFRLVATAYHNGEKQLGSLGVLRPSRMEYPRILPWCATWATRSAGRSSSAAATASREPGRG